MSPDLFTILDRGRANNLSEICVRILIAVGSAPTYQKKINEKLPISRAATGQAVKSLVTRELVYKTRNPNNERQVILTLTQTGKDLLAALTAPPSPACSPAAP